MNNLVMVTHEALLWSRSWSLTPHMNPALGRGVKGDLVDIIVSSFSEQYTRIGHICFFLNCKLCIIYQIEIYILDKKLFTVKEIFLHFRWEMYFARNSLPGYSKKSETKHSCTYGGLTSDPFKLRYGNHFKEGITTTSWKGSSTPYPLPGMWHSHPPGILADPCNP